MLLDMHADDRSLDPGTLDERLNRLLSPSELVLVTMLGEQPEAREIAEAIVDQRHDLAGELDDLLPAMVRRRLGTRRFNARHGAGGRGRDLPGVAAEPADPSDDESKIALQNRVEA